MYVVTGIAEQIRRLQTCVKVVSKVSAEAGQLTVGQANQLAELDRTSLPQLSSLFGSAQVSEVSAGRLGFSSHKKLLFETYVTAAYM